MKTNILLTIIIILLLILIGSLFYLFGGQAEKRAIEHIEQELNVKNDEKMAELKQIAFDHESIQLANSAISHLKMEMQLYLSNTGKLPTSLTDLNLPYNWTPSSKIKSVKLDNHSVVTITIDNTNSKGTLIFTPTIHQEHYIDWQCTTPNIKDIGLHLPTCAYTGK
ncbi:MAG: pilin [Moraxella sp.]|nr:pilin [Moraxella sp.]